MSNIKIKPISASDLKDWAYIRRKYRHKFGMCYKASQGYTCGGAENYHECE